MNHPVLVAVLLGVAVLAMLTCALGLLCMRGASAKLHFLGPTTLVSPLLVLIPIWMEADSWSPVLKASLVCVILLGQGPVLAHVLGRAIRLYDQGNEGNR